MSDYFFNNNNDTKKLNSMRKMYSYYPVFQKNNNYTINPNNYDLKNNNAIFIKIPINIGYKDTNIQNNNKFIYLNDPYINDINDTRYQNKTINLNNTNIYNHNSNEELYEKRKNNFNKYKNINLNFKRYSPKHMYDEFIIDYEEGLNRDLDDYMINNYKYKDNFNDYTLKNVKNKRMVNNHTQIYNKVAIKNDKLNTINNSNDLCKKNNISYKNMTYDSFYNINNPKENKNNINGPYKKRIAQDYNLNDLKDNYKNNNNNSKSKKIFIQNYTILPDNKNKIKKIIKNNSFNLDKQKFNSINNNNIIKNNQRNLIRKKPIPISNNIKSNKESLINKFIQHLSRYSMLYYYKIIKQLFSFLKLKKKKKILIKTKSSIFYKNKNSKTNRKLLNPLDKIKTTSYNSRTHLGRFANKSNGRASTEQCTFALIERIKNTNESKSQDPKGECEMYRNINELTKKYVSISNRKNRKNNLSSKKDRVNDISCQENKKTNDFKFSSVDKNKNKEKFEKAINKERERKKKNIFDKKKSKEKEIKNKNNKNNRDYKENISQLIEKNNELKSKIQKFEKNAKKKPLTMNWNLNDITINLKNKKKSKEKEYNKRNNNTSNSFDKEKEKEFSFGDDIKEKNKEKKEKKEEKNINSYNKKVLKNQKHERMKNKKINEYDIIKVKKITTKDKRINININYLYYEPPLTNIEQNKINNENQEKNNGNEYVACNKLSINLCGNKKIQTNNNKSGNEKIKYLPELTSIKEEDNKIELTENDTKRSIDRNDNNNN